MWIRDTLPNDVPGMRIFLYGYETTLTKSNSFQSVLDIALGFIGLLKITVRPSEPGQKPSLLFLAHSLGGIVLKQAIVSLASMGRDEHSVLDQIAGGVLFGVPSLGMNQASLLTMVSGQPNEELLKQLGEGSKYLRDLDDSFSGHSSNFSWRMNWAYETKESPTVQVRSIGTHIDIRYGTFVLTETYGL